MKQCCDSLGSDESEQLKYPSVVFYRFEVLGLARARLNHRVLGLDEFDKLPIYCGWWWNGMLNNAKKRKTTHWKSGGTPRQCISAYKINQPIAVIGGHQLVSSGWFDIAWTCNFSYLKKILYFSFLFRTTGIRHWIHDLTRAACGVQLAPTVLPQWHYKIHEPK